MKGAIQMAKKKTKEETEVKLGQTVETCAVINGCTVGCHADKLSFSTLSFNEEDNKILAHMVKNEEDVRVTIDLQKPDENFPAIQTDAKLKKCTINKTCDNPNLINMQFSSGQIAQLTNYIRAEEEIKLIIQQIQKGLFEKEEKQTEVF
jgi:hypothetical protein